jgi:hypothetical protein
LSDPLPPTIKPRKANSLIPPAPLSENPEELDPELAAMLKDESMWQDLQKKVIEPSNKSLWQYFMATIGAVAWATGASRTSKQMTESTAQAEKWTAGPDYAKKYFNERGAQFVTQVSDTDRQHIRQLLKDNWGVGERQFAKNIAGDYLLSKERAMLIYRSEAHETHEAGAYANAFYNGGKFKVWISNGKNACDRCSIMNGQVRPIEQPFDNGEQYPHLHPRCGCYAAYSSAPPTKDQLASFKKMGEVSDKADFANLDKYISVTVKGKPEVSRKGEVMAIQLGDKDLQRRMAEYIMTGKVPAGASKSPIFKEHVPKAAKGTAPISPVGLTIKGGKAKKGEAIPKKSEPKQKKLIDYKEASTIKDSHKFAESLGVKVVSGKSDTVAMNNQINKWLVDRKNAGLPVPARIVIDEDKFENKRVIANCDAPAGIINVNPKSDHWTDAAAKGAKNVKDGWHESVSVLDHEMGHYLHGQADRAAYEKMLANYRQPAGNVPAEYKSAVSKYAQTTQLEYVAEIYSGLVAGKSYPQDIMDYYESLGGPKV